jgi:hypothetical protein
MDPEHCLQEFQELAVAATEADMLAVLPFWPSVYNKLGTDGDRRVRELAHASLALVVPVVGKALTPHLKASVARTFQNVGSTQPLFVNIAGIFKRIMSPIKLNQ